MMMEYWYIWYEAFEDGKFVERGKYHRSYRRYSGARGRAKQMWSEPVYNPTTNTTTVYQWRVSQVCPWNGIKGEYMPKMVFKVPVVWSSMGYILVDADSSEEAMTYAKEHLDEFPLPRNGEYLDDSFEVDTEGEAIMVGESYVD